MCRNQLKVSLSRMEFSCCKNSIFNKTNTSGGFPDDTLEEQYLLKSKASDAIKKFPKYAPQSNRTPKEEELQQRLQIMANKMRSKKSKPSERTLKKREQKKLKKTKQLKKKVISVAKSIKNEKVKGKLANGTNEDVKPDIKPDVKPSKVFNEEGKIVFSKFEFAARPSQAKKSKKDSKWKPFALEVMFNHLTFCLFVCFRNSQESEIAVKSTEDGEKGN